MARSMMCFRCRPCRRPCPHRRCNRWSPDENCSVKKFLPARLPRMVNLAFTVFLLVAPAVFGAVTLEYRTDQILIQPKAGMSRAALTNFHAIHGAIVKNTFAAIGGVQVISLPVGETVPSLVAQYQQSGLVEFAEPDYIGQIY